MFLEVARKTGCKMILFAAANSRASDTEDLRVATRRLRNHPRRAARLHESRLRELRVHDGVTCSLELAFDTTRACTSTNCSRTGTRSFSTSKTKSSAHLPGARKRTKTASLGGYFSKN